MIKHASNPIAMACLERMIYNFTDIKAEKIHKKEEKAAPKQQTGPRV